MDINAYRDEVKLKLTGNLIQLEINDSTLDSIINAAFREVQRYIDTTKIITIPYKTCINLKDYSVSSVSRVFRTESYINSDKNGVTDPMYMSMWQMATGTGTLYNINDWTYNYASWNTALQNRNTISTDLLFRYDRHTNNLYINCAFDKPTYITVEYVPRYNSVDEIVSDFWIDIIVNLSVALTKVTVGRIRSRFTQTNALYSQDGDTLLTEGNQELTDIREKLAANNQLVYGID